MQQNYYKYVPIVNITVTVEHLTFACIYFREFHGLKKFAKVPCRESFTMNHL